MVMARAEESHARVPSLQFPSRQRKCSSGRTPRSFWSRPNDPETVHGSGDGDTKSVALAVDHVAIVAVLLAGYLARRDSSVKTEVQLYL